jgi:hypothetical protein
MTRHELGPGIIEVDISKDKFDEIISLKFWDNSNGCEEIASLGLFFDEAASLRDLLTETLKEPATSNHQRIIPKDQVKLIEVSE